MFDVFSNEDFIKKLTVKNQTLAKRLANHIGELVQKIREAVKMISVRYSNPEIKALMNDAEKLDTIRNMLLEGYKRASENFKVEQAEGQKNNAEGTAVKYSIHSDSQGYYVKIDAEQSIFDNKNIREMQSIARKIINQKYKGKVLKVGVNSKAYINKRSADEYAYPANRRMDDVIKEAKMRSSTELDNLLAISKFINNEPDDGRHPDATGGWDIYETRFEVANIMFTGEIKIKVTDRGFVFYDITQIRRSPVNGNQTKINSAVASGNLPNNSIHKTIKSVKQKFSMKQGVEEKGELIAVHNLSYDKITDALKLGGLPMPSIAVLKAKQGHNKYGEISVVFNKNTISPETDSRNKVYVADAYSPTFPNVRIKANKEKAQRLANILQTSVAGVESNIIDRNENEIVRKAASQHQLQRKYVEDNGIKVDGNKEPKFTNSFHKRMTNFIIENDITWEKLINNKKLQNEYIQKVTESTPSFRREKAVSEIKAIFENDFLIHNDAIINSFNTDFEIAKGNVEPSFDELTYLHNIREYLTDNSNPYGYNEDYIDFVKEYTDGIVDKTEIYTGEDAFLESGEENPNAYKDYTAENVVDVMKSQKHQNGGGIGYLRAFLGQQFGSIEDIRSNKNRLVTEAEFNEKADKLNDKFTEIASMGAEFNKGVGLWNVTHDTFVQAIENGATRQAMIDALNDNGFRWVKGDFVDKCMDFIEELKATPTEYFEAKPERVIEFNEIAFVVIPDNAPAKLVEGFEENGIEIRTYSAGDEKSRLAALNSKPEVLFSMKQGENKKQKIVNKSKTMYNEGSTLKMIWGNSKSTPVGTTWVKSERNGEFVIYEKTEDGYIELLRGKSSKEVRDAYERIYGCTVDRLYEHSENIRNRKRNYNIDRKPDKNRRGNNGHSGQAGGEKIQGHSERSRTNSTRNTNKEIDSIENRFSIKQTDPIQAHYAEVMRENRNLRNIISALDEMQYSSARSNIHLSGRDIHNIAGRLLKSVSSKYELKTFEDELTAVYEYMSQQAGKNLYKTEDFFPNVLAIARRVVDQVEELKRQQDSGGDVDIPSFLDIHISSELYL